MSRVRLGVIGAGAWGRNHVRTIAGLKDAELTSVCDASDKIRAGVQAQYPGVHVTDSVDELLARVDGVVIASSARSHGPLAMRAIAAGKAALVEKPFALSVAEASAMCEAAEMAGVPLLVGHLLEFHPVIDRLKTMLDARALGDVHYLYSQRLNLGQVRPDENALWSLGPHDVSVAIHLMGEAPVSVAAHGHAYLQAGIEDVVFLAMTFASGVVAHAHMSWLDPHKERKLTVVGSKQMAVFDDMAPREKLRIYDKGVNRQDFVSFGESLTVREGDIFIPKTPATEPLGMELAHFASVVQGAMPTRADALDGLRNIQVLEAASRSLRAGGAPVMIGTGQ